MKSSYVLCIRPFKVAFLLAIITIIIFAGCREVNFESSRIQPLATNKRFWQYKGEPVFLLGGNIDDNPFQHNREELESYFDELKKVGGNYIRNVMSDRDSGNSKAFKKLENGKFDLDQWNDQYWQKFKHTLELTVQRDIIVHITLWDRFDHWGSSWLESPWNPVNNINYTHAESKLGPVYKAAYRGTGINPFFKTPPTMENNPEVLYFQQEFIKKIMDISLEYGNVIYNMGNEQNIELQEWDRYWCKFIRDYAATKERKIETTAMFDKQSWEPVVDGNDIYTFVEGSKVGSRWTDAGEIQYDVAVELVKGVNNTEIRPVNAVKVRTQNIVYNAQARLWRPLMAGFAALSHHRHESGFTNGLPVGGLGFTEMARTDIKAMRIFTDKIQPWECIPRQDLLGDREEDEAYLLASEGEVYGLYFPKGHGLVTLNLKDQKRTFKVEWIDIGKGEIVLESKIDGGEIIGMETPHKVDYGWACCITSIN